MVGPGDRAGTPSGLSDPQPLCAPDRVGWATTRRGCSLAGSGWDAARGGAVRVGWCLARATYRPHAHSVRLPSSRLRWPDRRPSPARSRARSPRRGRCAAAADPRHLRRPSPRLAVRSPVVRRPRLVSRPSVVCPSPGQSPVRRLPPSVAVVPSVACQSPSISNGSPSSTRCRVEGWRGRSSEAWRRSEVRVRAIAHAGNCKARNARG